MNGFNLSDIQDAKLGATTLGSIYLGSTKLWPTAFDYSREYLTIESLADNNIISLILSNAKSTAVTIEYSYDKITWTSKTATISPGTTIDTLDTGDKIYIRGTNDKWGSSASYYNNFNSTEQYKVYGNIMSLLYGDNFIDETSLAYTYIFTSLFYNNAYLTDAQNLILPATTLTTSCYENIFRECTSLATVPNLPATTLANSCYNGMFRGCSSLTTVPSNYLSATTLTQKCYKYMFANCTSLTTAPNLSVTTLMQECYAWMFYGCTSLVEAPELPAETLIRNCYQQMFRDCTSLNYIKAMFTTTPSGMYTSSWVDGVASSGTFVKNASATWDVTGNNGIPSGWTVETASS